MSKLGKSWGLFFLLVLMGTLTSFIKPSLAAPTIFIHPRMLTGEPSETVSINVRIAQAADLFSWEFSLRWNTSVLGLIGVLEGDFLTNQPDGTFFGNLTDTDDLGLFLTVFCTTKGNYPGVSGDGALATITFKVLGVGETVLDLFNTKLRDSRPYPIDHASTDGNFTNAAGVPRASFTYSPNIAPIGETIVFNASASFDRDGFITSYYWEFGDGSTPANETDPITQHSYAKAGTFTVALTVTDNATLSVTKTELLKVRFEYDARIVDVEKPSQIEVVEGESVSIAVVAMNDGSKEISFNVAVYYEDNIAAPAQEISSLGPTENKTLQFVWETDGVTPGDYAIKAVASTVQGEVNVANNVRFDGTVTVKARPELPVGPIALGVVLVVALVVVVFLFLRRKKPAS